MISKNCQAFLDMLGWSEGTSTSRWTKNNGYDIIVDGINSPHVFTNYSTHPNVLVTVNSAGLKSTAAGRYQVLYRVWTAYKVSLNLPDFSPASQDAIAIQMFKECNAVADIEAGNIRSAIAKCASRWASLPGAGYGQSERSPDVLIARYQQYGGKLS